MKEYRIQGEGGPETFLSILEELDDSYRVTIRKIDGSSVRERTEMLTKHLFELCVRTGYLNEVEPVRIQIA